MMGGTHSATEMADESMTWDIQLKWITNMQRATSVDDTGILMHGD